MEISDSSHERRRQEFSQGGKERKEGITRFVRRRKKEEVISIFSFLTRCAGREQKWYSTRSIYWYILDLKLAQC